MRSALYVGIFFLATSPAFADARVNLCKTDVETAPYRPARGAPRAPAAPRVNLDQAIRIGGRITFDCSAGSTIAITREHNVDYPTEIDGENKVTLDGGDSTNMFRAAAGGQVFALRNIVLRRGKIANRPAMISGAMIIALDNVEISNSERPIAIEFEKIVARKSRFFANVGPVLDAPNLDVQDSRIVGTVGPAMRSSGGQVSLAGVQVAGNRAPTDAGSSFNNCTLVIHNSQFSDSWAMDSAGGAINSGCAKVRIWETAITGNRAQLGGGLHLSDATEDAELRSVNFSGNSAAAGGGALSIAPTTNANRSVRILFGIFRNNSAPIGGAIRLMPQTVPSSYNRLEGLGVDFKANQAERGGAIFASNSTVKLARAIFIDNQASLGAGAILLEGSNSQPFEFANIVVGRTKGAGASIEVEGAGSILNGTIAGNDVMGLRTSNTVELANTVVSQNHGANCQLVGAGGNISNHALSNLQFPNADCGMDIKVADPQLDDFFVPSLDSPVQRAGDNDVCRAQPVNAQDVYGQRRPRTDRCSIGAVEGDIEDLVRHVRRTDQR